MRSPAASATAYRVYIKSVRKPYENSNASPVQTIYCSVSPHRATGGAAIRAKAGGGRPGLAGGHRAPRYPSGFGQVAGASRRDAGGRCGGEVHRRRVSARGLEAAGEDRISTAVRLRL